VEVYKHAVQSRLLASNAETEQFIECEQSVVTYTFQTNASHGVPYRTQRFYVERRKGSIPSHFQEKVLRRNRFGSGFHTEPYATRSHSKNSIIIM